MRYAQLAKQKRSNRCQTDRDEKRSPIYKSLICCDVQVCTPNAVADDRLITARLDRYLLIAMVLFTTPVLKVMGGHLGGAQAASEICVLILKLANR